MSNIKHSKDLLRLEKDYFKDEDGEKEDKKSKILKKFIRKAERRIKPKISEFKGSSLLSSLKDFLPKLAQANELLELNEEKDKFRIDIGVNPNFKISNEENSDEESLSKSSKEGSSDEEKDSRIIKMNLFIPKLPVEALDQSDIKNNKKKRKTPLIQVLSSTINSTE